MTSRSAVSPTSGSGHCRRSPPSGWRSSGFAVPWPRRRMSGLCRTVQERVRRTDHVADCPLQCRWLPRARVRRGTAALARAAVPGLRTTLIALVAGCELAEHEAPDAATPGCLTWRVRMATTDHEWVLKTRPRSQTSGIGSSPTPTPSSCSPFASAERMRGTKTRQHGGTVPRGRGVLACGRHGGCSTPVADPHRVRSHHRARLAVHRRAISLPGRRVLAPGVQPKIDTVVVLTCTRAPHGNEYAEGLVAVDCDRHGLLAGRTHVRFGLALPFDHIFTICPYWCAGEVPRLLAMRAGGLSVPTWWTGWGLRVIHRR